MIQKIMAVHQSHSESEEGDKHLASNGYALEGIGAVLDDYYESPILRQFMEGEVIE